MSKLMTAAKQLPDQLTRLQAYADGLNARIKLLAKMGAIDAKEYWREGKYLILVTPSVRGQRERPFIGKDPEKIKEARAKIARHAEMVALSALARDTDAFMRDVERSIIGLHAELQTYTYSKTVPPLAALKLRCLCWPSARGSVLAHLNPQTARSAFKGS